MNIPVGWYVRVTTGEMADQVYDTVIYIAGFPTREEAESEVRAARLAIGKSGEPIVTLPDKIAPDCGPQPKPGEVRLLPGAV